MKKSLVSLGLAGFIFAASAQAAIVDHGTYLQDTDTGKYWLKLTETRGISYNNVTAQLPRGEAFEGWRYATQAEVDELITNYGIPASATSGNGCATGIYCGALDAAYAEQLEDLIALLGDVQDAYLDATGAANDVSPDGAGIAAGRLGELGDPNPGSTLVWLTTIRDGELVDRVSGVPTTDGVDAIFTQSVLSSTGTGNSGSFLVRETDPSIPLPTPQELLDSGQLTLFDDLAPEDIGLTVNCGDVFAQNICNWDNEGYFGYGQEDGGGGFNTTVFLLDLLDGFDAQSYPWMRMVAYERNDVYTAVSNPTFQFLPEVAATEPDPFFGRTIPGTFIEGADYCGGGGFCPVWVDNVELEFISNNIEIDFDPWNAGNIIYPKWTYLITVQITTTPEFDAADVDPDSLRVGPNMAEVVTWLERDSDNDGDIDFVFAFRMEETGIGCLDTTIGIAGRTKDTAANPLAPIAGTDTIVPTDCAEPIAIDVDPYNAPNIVRPDDDYTVTVGILGLNTTDGDPIDLDPASEINVSSLRFGPGQAVNSIAPVPGLLDNDNNEDLLVGFSMQDSGIACGDTELEMTGELNSGLPVVATDTIETTDCTTGSCHP